MKSILPMRLPAWACFLGFAVLLGGLSAGCKSPQVDPSPYLAAIMITNCPAVQIEAVTRAVFEEKGFKGKRVEPGEFVFEKEGSGMNNLVFNDWSAKGVWVRVKVFLQVKKVDQLARLSCDAFMVREPGDAHFEEEQKLGRMHRGHYQELLEKISQRLQSSALSQSTP